MTLDELRAWGNAHMKPFLQLALEMMPKDAVAGYLIMYGAAVGRAGGMTDAKIRETLEDAINAQNA